MGYISNTQLKSVQQKIVDNLKDGVLVPSKSMLTDNFDTKMVLNDKSAYNFRPTATMGTMELEVGSPCKEKAVIGGSLGWNQLAGNLGGYNTTRTKDGNKYTITTNVVGGYANVSVPWVKEHKYLICYKLGFVDETAVDLRLYKDGSTYITEVNAQTYSNTIFNATVTCTNYMLIGFYGRTAETSYTLENINVFDLTVMFGPDIADYLYSLTNRGGYNWFKRYFPLPYYSKVDIGSFAHVQTKGKKIVKFNQWDEQWEIGRYNNTNGGKEPGDGTRIRNKNPIPVFPSTTYYKPSTTSNVYYYDADNHFIDYESNVTTFTTPSNCYYICFFTAAGYGTTYRNDICINFHYDGERDGEYEAFATNTVAVDPVSIIGIPKLDSNNNLAFDGNQYNSDGSMDEPFEIIDLSTLDWTYNTIDLDFPFYYATVSGIKYVTDLAYKGDITASKYAAYSWNQLYGKDSGICVMTSTQNCIRVKDPSFTASVEPSGYLIYRKATASQGTPATPFTETQPDDNWGTEEWLAPDDDTRAVVVPVGHDTDYLPDYKAKVEVAADMPGEDGVYVLTQEDGENIFTSIATYLGDNWYYKQVDYSSQITFNESLTVSKCFAYKTGNIVTITIIATNNSGSDIAANSSLFTLPNDLIPPAYYHFPFYRYGSTSQLTINQYGSASSMTAVANGNEIDICITYAVA